jgi:hypothetical protein
MPAATRGAVRVRRARSANAREGAGLPSQRLCRHPENPPLGAWTSVNASLGMRGLRDGTTALFMLPYSARGHVLVVNPVVHRRGGAPKRPLLRPARTRDLRVVLLRCPPIAQPRRFAGMSEFGRAYRGLTRSTSTARSSPPSHLSARTRRTSPPRARQSAGAGEHWRMSARGIASLATTRGPERPLAPAGCRI